jgi:hypothetical protein
LYVSLALISFSSVKAGCIGTQFGLFAAHHGGFPFLTELVVSPFHGGKPTP